MTRCLFCTKRIWFWQSWIKWGDHGHVVHERCAESTLTKRA